MVWMVILFWVDGRSDFYYLKFTSPQQQSLILGTSEAAQGLLPKAFNSEFQENNFDFHIYNYAFTRIFSPYGKHYLNSIKKKLDPNSKDGIFILSVTPWSISVSNDLEDEAFFPEAESMIVKVKDVCRNPNFEYLVKCYSKPYYKLFIKNDVYCLNSDGWSEVSPPMDSESIEGRTKKKMVKLSSEIKEYKLSQIRLSGLVETINFLKNHGKIFLVAMPVDKRIHEINLKYLPTFEHLISELGDSLSVPFLDYSKDFTYKTTDGYHLYKDDGKRFSEKVANDIIEILNERGSN